MSLLVPISPERPRTKKDDLIRLAASTTPPDDVSQNFLVEVPGFSRTAVWSSSDNLLRRRVPAPCVLPAVRRNRHLASDRGPEAKLERANRFLAAAHAIEEVLHVHFGQFLIAALVGAGGRRASCLAAARARRPSRYESASPWCRTGNRASRRNSCCRTIDVNVEKSFSRVAHRDLKGIGDIHLGRQVVGAGHRDRCGIDRSSAPNQNARVWTMFSKTSPPE